MLSRWEGQRAKFGRSRDANIELREITDKLQAVRLPLDASDAEICSRAAELAADAMGLAATYHQPEAIREAMERLCAYNSIKPPHADVELKPAILRMTCKDWWRKQLRKMHAKAVEGAAIHLGYVNKARDLYVSNETVARRGQQVRRNQAMMEATIMRNEEGQEYALAELAALGTANKAIRRGELMTRIVGFEKIARECGHAGLFFTMTCPSRMHKFSKAPQGKVYPNSKYDGTSPRKAQKYLTGVFAKIRAKFGRDKTPVYGFRIAEPHHDACPHWHMLFFCEQGHVEAVESVMRRWALKDSPDEAGADEHRLKMEVIDWKRGSAAGYIAKYVAKNIDGLHVENDLFGNPAMETSKRVEAWATTWGIRQFQQVGGAPVGVWRELRRIKAMPEGAPEHLRSAWESVNKREGVEGVETKQADWAGYVKAQGGVFCGRNAAITLAKDETGRIGRYGEEMAARPVGVLAVGGEHYRDGIVPNRFRMVEWFVKSERHTWERVNRAGRSLAPRTCVNNCTQEAADHEGMDSGATAESGFFAVNFDGSGSGGGSAGAVSGGLAGFTGESRGAAWLT